MSDSTALATDAEVTGSDTGALSDVGVAYVNSLEQWRALLAAGLPETARVRTASPWLVRSGPGNFEAVDDAVDEAFITKLVLTFDELSIRLFEKLRGGGDTGAALTAAQAVWSAQRIAYDAALLRPEDFSQPICVASLVEGSAKLKRILQFNWTRLLAGNGAAHFVTANVDEGKLPYLAPPVADFRTRLRAARPADLLFRLLFLLASRTRRTFGLKAVYVLDEAELLKDATVSLLRRGWLLRPLPAPAKGHATTGPDIREVARAAEAWIETEIRGALAPFLDATAVAPTLRAIGEDVTTALEQYSAVRAGWDRCLDDLDPRPAAIVSNGYRGVNGIALAAAARSRDIPLVTFQHGATRELATMQDTNPIFFENLMSDLHFCFNDSHARITADGPFALGRCVTVGAPAFYAAARRRRSGRWPSLWYVSSALYMGAQDMLHRGLSDNAVCEFETDLVRRALAVCGKPVLYKPYPALRYLDPDPVVEAARRADNITVVEHAFDLRYMMHECEMLIATRTGSTIGYCLTQNLPLVYLKIRGGGLRPHVETALREAVFFFDAMSPNFFDDVTAFLARPMDEIAAMWSERQAMRDAFIRDHIAKSIGNGARTVAREVAALAG